MNLDQKLNQSIKELQRITGLPLELNIKEDQDEEEMIAKIQSVCTAYREANNKEIIIRRWLTKDISDSDFFSFAERMHLIHDAYRGVFLIRFKNEIYPEIITVLKNTFMDSNSWILQYQKNQLIVIYHFQKKKSANMKEKAYEMLDILNMELFEHAVISYGTMTKQLDELPGAFHKAELSLKIGNIFYPDRNIYGYDEMGEGSLLYGMSKDICADYININLGKDFLKSDAACFKTDLLNTANCFLKNNLNIAETARQMHIHRNTLLYRLEQIQNESGLDIRRFNHAMTYKLCSLIILYIG